MEQDDFWLTKEQQIQLNNRIEFNEAQENLPLDKMMEILHRRGISLTVEEVLQEYRKTWDIEETADELAGRYEDYYDDRSTLPEDLFDEDLFFPLVMKAVREHIGEAESGDAWFIDDWFEKLEKRNLKRVRQSEVEDLIRMLIINSKNRNNHLIEKVGDDFSDYNSRLIGLMPACKNRGAAFQELMRKFFKCYEDANPGIYPSLYRSMYGTDDTELSYEEQPEQELANLRRLTEKTQRLKALLDKLKAQEKMPVPEILRVLNKNDIDLSEERILKDYDRVNSVDKLSDEYWKEYEDKFEQLDDDTGFVDEDILIPLVDKVIRENRDIVETGDVFFADNLSDELDRRKAKEIRQEEVETLVAILIRYSEIHHCHRIQDIDSLFNYDARLTGLVKSCHNRNAKFNELMTRFYECYEDADPNIYPSLYRRIKGKK